MSNTTSEVQLSDKNIDKIRRAIKQTYTGEFIINVPLRVKVIRGKVVRIKEVEIKQIERTVL